MNQQQKNYYKKCIEAEMDNKLAKLGMNSYGTGQHKRYSRYDKTDSEKAIQERYNGIMQATVLEIVKKGKVKTDTYSKEHQECVMSNSGRHSYPSLGHYFDLDKTIDGVRRDYQKALEHEDKRVTKLCDKIKDDAFKLTNKIMFDGATNLIELIENFTAKEYK